MLLVSVLPIAGIPAGRHPLVFSWLPASIVCYGEAGGSVSLQNITDFAIRVASALPLQ